MTVQAGPVRASAGPREIWARGRRIERICYAVGALLFAAGVFHLGVFAVDGGSWEGPVSWRKPVTFGTSFGLTLVTIAWVSSYVRLGDRARSWVLGSFAVACVVEVALITVQAWRHVPSHFNNEGSFNTLVARVLAAGGAVLVATLVTLTVAAFRHDAGVAPSMRLAVRVGFVALMGALLSGAAMIARGVTLEATGHQQAAYTVAGALKPAHAVTMHAILVLPALAWLLARTSWDEPRRVRTVALTSAAYAVAAVAVIAYSLVDFATG